MAQARNAHEPKWFTTAPVGAIQKVLAQAGWKADDVDLFEINEAFANVAMIAMRDLDLPHEKVNVNGGACALGHPIGASGARIIVTLLNALQRRGRQARHRRALHRRRRSDGRGGGAAVMNVAAACFPQPMPKAARISCRARRRRAATLESYVNPNAKGPDGEELTTDVARIGPAGMPRASW